MRSVSSSMDVHGISYTDKTKKMERLKRVQRIQKITEVKEPTYYDKRGLTQTDQTGEIFPNISAKEIFEIEKARSQNTKAYTNLHKTEKEKVRDFKSTYQQKDCKKSIQTEEMKEEIQNKDIQEEYSEER